MNVQQYSIHFTIILDELSRIQALPEWRRDEDDDAFLPRFIETEPGRGFYVSKAIEMAIVRIADLLLDDKTPSPLDRHRPLRDRTSLKEWRFRIHRAFGQVLLDLDFEQPAEGQVAPALETLLGAMAAFFSDLRPREHAFGCTLFSHKNEPPFNIGPVRFEPRLAWLGRQHDEGSLSKTNYRRIQKRWSGSSVRKRKPSLDANSETDVLQTIADCPYVVSVVTQKVEGVAALDKALLVSRLALTAISLQWQTPSKALQGMNLLFDRGHHVQFALATFPGTPGLASGRKTVLPHALSSEQLDWGDILKRKEPFFQIIGELLNTIVDPDLEVTRPEMMRTLFHALFWFHEACREPVSLLAVVKHASALDALAKGRKSGGIERLLAARLGLKKNDPVRPNGPSMHEVVKEIYSAGRSRTLHGSSDYLGNDASSLAAMSEALVRPCLLACIDWMSQNPNSDNPNELSN